MIFSAILISFLVTFLPFSLEDIDTQLYTNTTYDSRYGCNAIIEKATNTLVLGCQNTIIPKSVKNIGHHAFYKCNGLTEIVLSNNIESIGSYAFRYCGSLASVILPDGIKILEDCVFQGCTSLKSITIPNSVKTIGELAFASSGLATIEIPEGVENIGDRAFMKCSNLTYVKIPSSISSIGLFVWLGAFYENFLLTKAEYANVESLCKIKFVQKNDNPLTYAHHLYIDGEEVTDVIVPAGVDSIKNYVFSGMSSMTSLTIGKDVTVLENIFADDATVCPKDIYCYATNIPSVENTFNNTPIGNITLHVPASKLEEYEGTMPWCDFGEILPIDEPVQGQCATPTIAFVNGQLHFSCDTEGAQFVCKISSPETEVSGETVDLLHRTNSYTISVYATAEGYLNSEVATTTVTLNNVRGDIDGNGFVTIKDVTELIDIYLDMGQ